MSIYSVKKIDFLIYCQNVFKNILISIVMASKKNTKTTEPTPEGDNDVVENKQEFATYGEAVKERKSIDAQIKVLQARRKVVEKACDTHNTKTEKESKKGRRKVKKEPDPNRKKSGIDKEIVIPLKIYNFIVAGLKARKFSDEITTVINEFELTKDSMVPRCKLIKWVYNYIQHNELYKDNGVDKINKKFMVPDAPLTKLLAIGPDDPELTFESFQTYFAKLIPKAEKKPVIKKTAAEKAAEKKAAEKAKKEAEEEEEEEEDDDEDDEDDDDDDEDDDDDDDDDDDEEEEEEEEEEEPEPEPVKKTKKAKTAKK